MLDDIDNFFVENSAALRSYKLPIQWKRLSIVKYFTRHSNTK